MYPACFFLKTASYATRYVHIGKQSTMACSHKEFLLTLQKLSSHSSSQKFYSAHAGMTPHSSFVFHVGHRGRLGNRRALNSCRGSVMRQKFDPDRLLFTSVRGIVEEGQETVRHGYRISVRNRWRLFVIVS